MCQNLRAGLVIDFLCSAGATGDRVSSGRRGPMLAAPANGAASSEVCTTKKKATDEAGK